ncbi:MAG TPA: acyl-CoA dehydrogenase family protein [Solirubrobacteraceae bacterium]|jgi:alkylation response protein AidB-like acyl-CoA dehydrogenase|nr:acyl-CoA dehydrogenase family protein [Solirubrobacteraceae bacterium]
MDFGLSTDQREIQRTARELLEVRARPERVREHAEAGRFDEPLWRELCELGWPGIAISERYGGQGLGLVELSILCEELGRSLAPVPLLPSVLAGAVIEQAGSPEQRERWLPGLAGGETIGALGTVRDGVAELVVGAPEAQVLVLLEGNASSVRAYAREEVEVESCDSIDPTRPAALVRVSDDAGETLDGDVAGGIDRALVAIASELVGVSERALDMTVVYVKERKQFGVPVGSYQAVSHRCAQMLLETEKARSTTAFAAWAADADPRRLGEAAAMAKAAASEAGVEVTASAIQAHGGIGFTWEADVHWLYKRALLDAALLGGAKRQRARLAKVLAER